MSQPSNFFFYESKSAWRKKLSTLLSKMISKEAHVVLDPIHYVDGKKLRMEDGEIGANILLKFLNDIKYTCLFKQVITSN